VYGSTKPSRQTLYLTKPSCRGGPEVVVDAELGNLIPLALGFRVPSGPATGYVTLALAAGRIGAAAFIHNRSLNTGGIKEAWQISESKEVHLSWPPPLGSEGTLRCGASRTRQSER
jgi:hypothetical protein